MSSDSTEQTDWVTSLQQLIATIEMSGYAILPQTNQEMLQGLIDLTNYIFGANASAIALLTADGLELEFVVAQNVINQNIIGMRFPSETGIAGYVTMTGESLIVSHVEEDARFNRSFAEKSGYIPRSILASPLIFEDDTLGVVEVLDKRSGESFTLQDIELLSMLAQQSALVVGQSKQLDELKEILVRGLTKIIQSETADGKAATAELVAALENQPRTSANLIELANIMKDVVALGDSEREACRKIIQTFQDYSQSKKTVPNFGLGFNL